MNWVPRLRRYAHALLHHPDDADDLVQATLEHAWTKSSHWPQVTDMRAWLFTLMHNLYIDQIRRPKLTLVELDDKAINTVVAEGSAQEARANLLDLEAALARLPTEQKEVILLVALEDMSYAQVANALGIPQGTVMSRLSRGRERLRELMDDTRQGTFLKSVK